MELPDFSGLGRRLDLVVPTRGRRARHLLRTLTYLRDRRFPGRVLVRDHGSDAEAAQVRRIVGQASGLDIAVARDDDDVHFLERIWRAVEGADAPHVMIHADDDFLVPAGAEAAVAMLEDDAGLVLAQGRMARIAAGADGCPGTKPYPVKARPEDDPEARALSLLEGYAATFYAVHRRTALVENLGHTLAWSTDTTFWQYLNAATAVLQGRTAVAETLFYLRLAHEGSWSYRSVADRDPEHPPWVFLSPRFSDYLARFRGGLRAAHERHAGPLGPEMEARYDAACIALLRRTIGGGGAGAPEAGEAALHARLADRDSLEWAVVEDCVARVIASARTAEESP